MPHIHTDAEQHDFTITAYIIRIDTPEPRAMLHMHRKLDMLLPAGGHIELLETPWQALAHEVEEEAGYELSQLHVLQPKSRIKSLSKVAFHPTPLSMNTHSVPVGHFHTDIEYGFVTESEPNLSVKDGESLDIRWLTRAELNALDPAIVFENTKEIYTFMLDEALQNWERVPATSFVLDFPEEYK